MSYINAGLVGTIPGSQGGSLVLVEQHTASNSSNLAFTTGFTSAYDDYQLEIVSLIPHDNGVNMQLQLSTNAGGTWISAANYVYANFDQLASSANGAHPSQAATSLDIVDTARWSNVGGCSASGTIYLTNMLNGTNFVIFNGKITSWLSATDMVSITLSGGYKSAITANAIQLISSSGLIASGTARLYGIAKS